MNLANQGYMVGEVTPEAGIFWGIPFSQPPTGEYRWKNPREPLNFDKPYWDATYTRPACIQTCSLPAEEYSCPQEVRFIYRNSNNDVWDTDAVDKCKLVKKKTNLWEGERHYLGIHPMGFIEISLNFLP